MIHCPPAARSVSGQPASGTEYPCPPWPFRPTARWPLPSTATMLGATGLRPRLGSRAVYPGGWEGTEIEAAAISPDGQTIVTKQDFSLRVCDAATGKELRKIELKRAEFVQPE